MLLNCSDLSTFGLLQAMGVGATRLANGAAHPADLCRLARGSCSLFQLTQRFALGLFAAFPGTGDTARLKRYS